MKLHICSGRAHHDAEISWLQMLGALGARPLFPLLGWTKDGSSDIIASSDRRGPHTARILIYARCMARAWLVGGIRHNASW
jgi:hypothetical protein